MTRLPALIAVVAMVASCAGDDPEPATTATGTISTLAPVTSGEPTTSPPAATTSLAPSTTAVDTTTTAGPGAPHTLVVAGPEGVALVAPDGTVTELVEGSATVAVDDTMGGLLFQTVSGGRDAESGVPIPPESSWHTTVWWVWAGSDAPRELLVPDPGNWLTLEDALMGDDALTVFYQRRTGSGPEDLVETLRRFDATSGEVTEIGVIGAWESASDVSIGESLIARSWFAEVQCGLDFMDHAGAAADVPGAPATDTGEECAGGWHGELSPDDSRLAYTERTTNAAGLFASEDVVVVDTVTGEELSRIAVRPEQVPWQIDDLDLGGDMLVLNRVAIDNPLSYQTALVYDLADPDGEPSEVAVPGRAAIARSAVSLGGTVTAP